MPRFDHQPLDQRDQLVALPRRHAGGRLVHQQQPRLVGERDRKLDALDVAIGELAAGRSAGVRHADLRQQFERALAMALGGRRRTSNRSRCRARAAPSARSRPPSSSRRSRRSGRCGRRRAARSARGVQSGDVRALEQRCAPPSGLSWPLIMLKQVVLPAPFGPISARNSPSSTSKLTSSTACTPPNDLLRCVSTASTLIGAPSIAAAYLARSSPRVRRGKPAPAAG